MIFATLPRLLSRLLVACIVSVSGLARAANDSLPSLLAAARVAENRLDPAGALDLLLAADRLQPDNAAILQRISRQYSDLVIDASDDTEKKRLEARSLDYAQRAVALAPNDAVNVLSLAIAYGKLGLLSDVRTRIDYSRRTHDLATQALALAPNYAYAHHVLGHWHYAVAALGPGQRFVVRVVYGGLPPASTAEAVRHLRRATELEPGVAAHFAELGFALQADGQAAAARTAWEHALTLPVRDKYDQDCLARVRTRLDRRP